MDRLHSLNVLALLALLAGLAACGKSDSKEPPASRGDTVKTTTTKAVNVEAFCDSYHAGDSGPAFTLPELVGGTVAASTKAWRWINVWASWCHPCVEEMPRLLRWHDKLLAAGHPFELAFVSIDEKDEDLADFRKAHPDAPGIRLARPAMQPAWFSTLGLDSAAPIPVHVFVTPTGHVRCARAGGIRDGDYAAIEKLLSE